MEALKKSPAEFHMLVALGQAAYLQNQAPVQKAMARAKKGSMLPMVIQGVMIGTRGAK